MSNEYSVSAGVIRAKKFHWLPHLAAWISLLWFLQRAQRWESIRQPSDLAWYLVAALWLSGFAITGRALRGGWLAVIAYLWVRGISWTKSQVLDVPLLASDIQQMSWVNVIELVRAYPRHALLLFALIIISGLTVRWMCRGPNSAKAPWRISMIVISGALLTHIAIALKNRELGLDPGNIGVLTFISSFYDTPPSLTSETASQAAQPQLQCPVDAPNIMMVLQESTFRPPKDALNDPRLTEFFDGNRFASKLSVHVIGGMTHLSEFAVLTGVPHIALSGENTFPQGPLAGRLQHTLPQILKACGYTTAVVYPNAPGFFNSNNWYRGLNFDIVHSAKDLSSNTDWLTRDKNLYDHALDVIRPQLPIDRPYFIYALTIAQHGPHGSDPYPEYIRRLKNSAEDWIYLQNKLTQQNSSSNKRSTVLAWFGDHRPFSVGTEGPDRKETWGVISRINPRSTSPITEKGIDTHSKHTDAAIDIAFFGHLVLREAGVALQPKSDKQSVLMGACPQAYLDCDATQRSDFHRTLIDLAAFPSPIHH